MKIPFIFFLAGAVGAANILQRAGCPGDNCNRAVTGTAKGSSRVVAAKSDCSSFLETTVTQYTRYLTNPSPITLPSEDGVPCY
jgi:hypothetical protein